MGMNLQRHRGDAPAASVTAAAPDFARVRLDFPRARNTAYLDNASIHPLGVHAAAAVHRVVEWETHEVGDPWWPGWAGRREECKRLFADLIGADEDDIAFARSTTEAENNLLNGLDVDGPGANVVTNDLHYRYSLYNYLMRQRRGLDVRIVKHRNWQIEIEDLERVVDDDTKLISIALVSNVNGYLHDIRAIADLAHAHGAYLFADIIQGAGAIPIDVEAMGIDMAACATFKWLMGLTGFGFVYVRKDLQGSVVRPSQLSGEATPTYGPWNDGTSARQTEFMLEPVAGPEQYELSYPSFTGVVAALESLRYIHQLGVPNIRAHARELTDRLVHELPGLGFPSITPAGNDSPIVAFACEDPTDTVNRLRRVDVQVAMRFGNKMRISPSVYNNQEDVSRLLQALS